MGSSTHRIKFAGLILLMGAVAACSLFGEPAPPRPMPEPMALPANAALLYWIVEGEPVVRDEVLTLYSAGEIAYLDRVKQRKGSQFLMPSGVEYFLDTLQKSGWLGLQPAYRPSSRGRKPQPTFVTLSARIGGIERTVQWEAPACPKELVEIEAELNQLLAVVRDSAR